MPKSDSKKSNIDYLREQIKGNDEANEWLDAISKELDEAKGSVNLESAVAESLRGELDGFECGYGLSNTLDAGMGEINWQSDSPQLESMMEELGEAIDRGIIPVDIEGILRAL